MVGDRQSVSRSENGKTWTKVVKSEDRKESH